MRGALPTCGARSRARAAAQGVPSVVAARGRGGGARGGRGARVSQDRPRAHLPACAVPGVPAPTGAAAPKNDWAGLFECRVRRHYVFPPILQGRGGHLVCSNRRRKAPVVSDLTCRARWDPLAAGAGGRAGCALFPLLDARSLCPPQRKRTAKSPGPSGLTGVTGVRALVLPVTGRALWAPSCRVRGIGLSPLQPSGERL